MLYNHVTKTQEVWIWHTKFLTLALHAEPVNLNVPLKLLQKAIFTQ